MQHDPSDENKKFLSTYENGMRMETMSVKVSLTKAKGISKGHSISLDRGSKGAWESEYERPEIIQKFEMQQKITVALR